MSINFKKSSNLSIFLLKFKIKFKSKLKLSFLRSIVLGQEINQPQQMDHTINI
ncbi:hypothetical protein BpHYR1_031750 [Brachionus plicatilis]|uniref:Uncharacterized protein n=1 Tax=Brachionus plicatilis TaxID=10195 RepID=A0A3M7RB08_BRAPC|nr:hypothetical protein BpHYR1_031750 [Brachionus plicatilis]